MSSLASGCFALRSLKSLSAYGAILLVLQGFGLGGLLYFLIIHQQQATLTRILMGGAIWAIALSVSAAAIWRFVQVAERRVRDRTQILEQEVSDRKQVEAALRESQHFLQRIADAVPQILYLFDLSQGRTLYLNQQSVTVLGYSPDEICAGGPQWLIDRFHSDDRHLCADVPDRFLKLSDQDILSTEYRFRHKDGEWRWLNTREVVFARDRDGVPIQILGSVQDITEQKQTEAALQRANLELQNLVTLDSLTQIANRRRFDEYLMQEWHRLVRDQQPLALILADVDYFKAYNDYYGHQQGDVCLKQVTQAMQQAVKRSIDLLARYGGEEFAVILPNTDHAGAVAVAEAIQAEIRQLALPHPASLVDPLITLSLGIAYCIPSIDQSSETLVAAADTALYQAKSHGRNRYRVYPSRSHTRSDMGS